MATVAWSFLLYDCSFIEQCCYVSAAISAPLKLKASRGPPTPINRNQASQPRVGQSLLGKRGFDGVSIPRTHTHYDIFTGFSFNKICSLRLTVQHPNPDTWNELLQILLLVFTVNFTTVTSTLSIFIVDLVVYFQQKVSNRPPDTSLSSCWIFLFPHSDLKEHASAVDAFRQS